MNIDLNTVSDCHNSCSVDLRQLRCVASFFDFFLGENILVALSLNMHKFSA